MGGGKVALRKVEQLLLAGAQVTIISPEVESDLQKIIEQGACLWEQRKYSDDDLTNYKLVIATTNQPEVNRYIYAVCNSNNIPINVVDQPDLCTVYFTAQVRSDPLLVAVSTGGEAPFLAREFRKRLDEWIAKEGWNHKARWAARLREFARKHTDDPAKRERCFEWFMSLPSSVLAGWDPANPPEDEWVSRLEGN